MADAILCTLRDHRAAAGLTQAALASRVGVSRQALIAIEAGRQVPSTALALLLARSLGCSVEDLFRLPGTAPIQARLAGESSDARVALGCIDGTWAAHPLKDGAHPGDGLVVRSAAGSADIEPLTDLHQLEQNVLVAGCAPLLGVLAGRLGRRRADARGTWIPANSTEALDLLDNGLVHIAGMHLAQTSDGHADIVRERFPGHDTLLVHLTRWRQGLVVAPGNPRGITGIDDLRRPELRVARRDPGSGAQKLLERLLPGSPTTGPLATSHADVARLIRWGVADVGVAIESAALAEGLVFLPLSEERFDLLVPRARLDAPPVARLLELIDAPAFRAEAARLPGYDLSASGSTSPVEAA